MSNFDNNKMNDRKNKSQANLNKNVTKNSFQNFANQRNFNSMENEKMKTLKEEPEDFENEVENKIESENNIFSKIADSAQDFPLNEENFDEIMQSQLDSKEVKDYFKPCLYNTNEFTYKPEISANSKRINELKTQRSQLNKSNDNISKQRDKSADVGKSRIEVTIKFT